MSKTLTIDVSDDLYTRLERRAKLNQRTLHEEVVHRLEESNDDNDMDRDALWERIRNHREAGPTIELDPMELKEIMREGLA